MATEQYMYALDHLALGRVGQFCDKWFELPIFPAKVQTIHITSTFHDNVSKITQYLQQQSQLNVHEQRQRHVDTNTCGCSLMCQGQPAHTPGKGGPTSVTVEEVGNKTHCTLSIT